MKPLITKWRNFSLINHHHHHHHLLMLSSTTINEDKSSKRRPTWNLLENVYKGQLPSHWQHSRTSHMLTHIATITSPPIPSCYLPFSSQFPLLPSLVAEQHLWEQVAQHFYRSRDLPVMCQSTELNYSNNSIIGIWLRTEYTENSK